MTEKVVERFGTFSVCREERFCLDTRISVLLEADQTGRCDQMERVLDLRGRRGTRRNESQSKDLRVQEREREFKRVQERGRGIKQKSGR